MGYEWNDRLEEDYRRYVGDKWFQGLRARHREGYRKARDRWQRSRQMGNRFRDGMALLRGQTPERGYQKEVRIVTDRGVRYHDVFSHKLQRGNEYKAGRVEKDRALPQLEKDDRFMATTPGGRIDWTIVQGARVDREVLDKFVQLKGKYPRQFIVQEVTREQWRLALTIGKHLEKQQRVKEREARAQERAEKERQRRAERDRILAKQRPALAKAVQEKTYELAQAVEQGRDIDPVAVNNAHKDARKQLSKIRKMEQQQTREMLRDIGVTGEAAKVIGQELAQGRESRRQEVARGIESIGRIAERAEQTRQVRESSDKHLAQQRSILEKAGVPEVAIQALEKVNKGVAPPAVVAERDDLPAAPKVVRGGHAALELARQQERDRQLGIDERKT